jgi:uncharacterized C2H2 Zn-finger protein
MFLLLCCNDDSFHWLLPYWLFHCSFQACPVCSEMVTRDMVNHITMQHGYLFKNRRRLRRFIIPGSQALSLLSRDLREAHLQVLLGGGHRSSNNNTTTNISADPLLSSFGLSFPTSDAEQTSKSTNSAPDDATMIKEIPSQARKLRYVITFMQKKHCCLAWLILASASSVSLKSRHCSVKLFYKPVLKWTRSRVKPVFLASPALASLVKPFWVKPCLTALDTS